MILPGAISEILLDEARKVTVCCLYDLLKEYNLVGKLYTLLFSNKIRSVGDNSLEMFIKCEAPLFFEHALSLLLDETEMSTFDIQSKIWKNFLFNDIQKKFLLTNSVVNKIMPIIGTDLQFQSSGSLTISLSKAQSVKHNNYLFKKYHQELWSGNSISSLQFWTPLIESNHDGQLVVIDCSHTWGLVPNENRKPVALPHKYEETKLKLSFGDVLIFHPLLLHKSAPMPERNYSRLSMPLTIRNWRIKSQVNFEERHSWDTYSYSPLTSVEMKLGNSYLSPFRLVDVEMMQPDGRVV
ncbi:phytanoyl-CoA dioxygenase family protein [Synechococcus sp. PROS-U-1]|nr:phytanoyl-CoA dioxygenase family protein [Synechococcus sp. PROS-U-1]